jgi:hypothetical protein
VIILQVFTTAKISCEAHKNITDAIDHENSLISAAHMLYIHAAAACGRLQSNMPALSDR